jgi:hypothetical protein
MIKILVLCTLLVGFANDEFDVRTAVVRLSVESVGYDAGHVFKPGFVPPASLRFDQNPQAEAPYYGQASGRECSGKIVSAGGSRKAEDSTPQVKIRRFFNVLRGKPG